MAAAGVRPTTVVRLAAAGANLASLGFCHVSTSGEDRARNFTGLDVRCQIPTKERSDIRCQISGRPTPPRVFSWRLISDNRHRIYEIVTSTWSAGPLRLITKRADRRVGLRPLAGPFGALFRTHSVHTFGMSMPIGVVVLDRAGWVLRACIVPPRRVVISLRAHWIVELPVGPLPETGELARCRRTGNG